MPSPARDVPVFVQMVRESTPPRALCTTVRYTADGRLVLSLDGDAGWEELVLVRDGRYDLPLVEARAGRHWEVTLAAPSGERIMLQFDRVGTSTAPPPEEGDEAVAAC